MTTPAHILRNRQLMNEAKHTEAPWQKCERGDYSDYKGNCIVILGDDGAQRVAIAFEEADATLIAAAPNMLAALLLCQEAIRYLPTTGTDEVAQAQNAAAAAVSLASGSQP